MRISFIFSLILIISAGIFFKYKDTRIKESMGKTLGFFNHSMDFTKETQSFTFKKESKLQFLNGYSHLRVLPGKSPEGMEFHFDGLATMLKLSFNETGFDTKLKAYDSYLYSNYDACYLFGSGTASVGFMPCFKNPLVNILPIAGQFWLTIDTSFWGKIDYKTLETIEGQVDVMSWILNAHPACDNITGDCYVEHPCSVQPLSKSVCISKLIPGEQNLKVETLTEQFMDTYEILQHSHSLGISETFVVVKLDSFETAIKDIRNSGLLGMVQQKENNKWLVMDRKTNKSKILSSNKGFVNNHIVNTYEDQEGNVVTLSAPAGAQYLDTYFTYNLAQTPDWNRMFPICVQKCVARYDLIGDFECTDAFKDTSKTCALDYPSVNPSYKMKDSQFFWAVSPENQQSLWFNRIIKVDLRLGEITHFWLQEDFYVTEANFIPYPDSKSEDDGILFSILFNEKEQKSYFGFFEAKDCSLIEMFEYNQVIPFHAHGITCDTKQCYPNP